MRALFALLFAARVFAQEFGHLEVQRVVANLHFAEGPVWSYDGFLLFSDTVVDKLLKVTPGRRGCGFRRARGWRHRQRV